MGHRWWWWWWWWWASTWGFSSSCGRDNNGRPTYIIVSPRWLWEVFFGGLCPTPPPSFRSQYSELQPAISHTPRLIWNDLIRLPQLTSLFLAVFRGASGGPRALTPGRGGGKGDSNQWENNCLQQGQNGPPLKSFQTCRRANGTLKRVTRRERAAKRTTVPTDR